MGAHVAWKLLTFSLMSFVYCVSGARIFIGEELYVGCYSRFPSNFNIELPLKECIQLCSQRHFYFAGMKGESGCHCGNKLNRRVPSQKCKSNKKFFVFTVVPAYLGCFKDDFDRDMDPHSQESRSQTNENCIYRCRSLNFTYAGTQYEYTCFCGKSFGRKGAAADGECNMKCTGNAEQYCGSAYKNSVYAVDHIPGLGMTFPQMFHCVRGSDIHGFCQRSQCKPGWKGSRCEQRDCSVENGHCGIHLCKEFKVRRRIISECLCMDGFESSSIYHKCKDVDECNFKECKKDHQVCVNTYGSSVCSFYKDEFLEDDE